MSSLGARLDCLIEDTPFSSKVGTASFVVRNPLISGKFVLVEQASQNIFLGCQSVREENRSVQNNFLKFDFKYLGVRFGNLKMF